MIKASEAEHQSFSAALFEAYVGAFKSRVEQVSNTSHLQAMLTIDWLI